MRKEKEAVVPASKTQSSNRPPRRFTAEFEAGAVRLVLEERRRVSSVAQDLGLHDSVLSAWVKQAHIDSGNGPAGAMTISEKEELIRLRKKIRILKEERTILKNHSLFREGECMKKFAFIDVEKANHSINILCRVLKVSRSGYYAFCERRESNHASIRASEDRRFRVLCREACEVNESIYGSIKIHRALKDKGERIGRKRVIRLMKLEGLRGKGLSGAKQRRRIQIMNLRLRPTSSTAIFHRHPRMKHGRAM